MNAPRPTIAIGEDGIPRVIDEPETAWDRDVRAVACELARANNWKDTSTMSPEGVADRACRMADEIERARRKRAPQLEDPRGPFGLCLRRVMPARGPEFACLRLAGHAGSCSDEEPR